VILDDRESTWLYDAISTAVARDIDYVLTLVNVEHPLTDALHDAVVRGAYAAANGVIEWHVVAEHESKAIALARELPGVERAVFADEHRARRQAACSS
jgi:hypothetical protein